MATELLNLEKNEVLSFALDNYAEACGYGPEEQDAAAHFLLGVLTALKHLPVPDANQFFQVEDRPEGAVITELMDSGKGYEELFMLAWGNPPDYVIEAKRAGRG